MCSKKLQPACQTCLLGEVHLSFCSDAIKFLVRISCSLPAMDHQNISILMSTYCPGKLHPNDQHDVTLSGTLASATHARKTWTEPQLRLGDPPRIRTNHEVEYAEYRLPTFRVATIDALAWSAA